MENGNEGCPDQGSMSTARPAFSGLSGRLTIRRRERFSVHRQRATRIESLLAQAKRRLLDSLPANEQGMYFDKEASLRGNEIEFAAPSPRLIPKGDNREPLPGWCGI